MLRSWTTDSKEVIFLKTKPDGSEVKVVQYLVTFDAREMVQIMTDKVPTEEEALEQLRKQLASRETIHCEYCSHLREAKVLSPWNITQVIEMDEDGDSEYLVYDGSRWVTREELECNG